MVEFLKTKPTSYINKPRGLINVDTGATQVGNAIAKLGSEIQERGFRDAVVEQVNKKRYVCVSRDGVSTPRRTILHSHRRSIPPHLFEC